MAPHKRKLSVPYSDDDYRTTYAARSAASNVIPPYVPDPSEHISKHRRTASGSDFSTYDIRHALDMPPTADTVPTVPLPQPPPAATSQEHPQEEAVQTQDLAELLDFTQSSSISDISSRFEQLAIELLHNYDIEITRAGKTELLEILELECYLYKTGTHEDPFTHASAEQSQSGRWYFHRPPRRSNDPAIAAASPSGYRGGTRKGLDLTIGKPPPGRTSKFFPTAQGSASSGEAPGAAVLRGGILLRSIRRVSDSKVVSGPSLLVDEVLRVSGANEILELVAVNWDGDIAAFPPTSLAPASRLSTMWLRRRAAAHPDDSSQRASSEKPRIFRSPRIGLDISHPSVAPASAHTHPRVTFVALPYRFFVSPHLLTANGRGQTFLGVYDALLKAGYCESDEELVEELARLTGVKGPTAAKYLGALREGLEAGGGNEGLKEWIGPKGKTVLSSVTAWLKMMGTLRRLGIATIPG
ncbi:hypothetical protein PYCCODRAFT_1471422 [Trametes coccinea BRFM310]|uniref:Uncharacterized protein n=1 Tax=Trametes coccinea (strain BRFM310) TaxID=1353009 RepID=A0A1Y2I9X7_TRAC3|nr:hypothetical protein PYCCODRAFT_1471422 [Trametes coccinea BRFM310]